MAIMYTTGSDTYLRDINKVPITETMPAVTFSGRPGNLMAVYETHFDVDAIVVTGGECEVPEADAGTSTLVAFDPANAPQALLVAP